jgi:hypothetical protein
LGVLASVLVALLAAGLARRARPTAFRIASYDGLRQADVRLDDVPCDFLAWEHLNWECSTLDRGVHGETGLATSAPLHVGGRDEGLFLITTQRGRDRHVRWDQVEAGDTLALRTAVPDELAGGGTLRVAVEGEELATLRLPPRPDGRLTSHDLDTSAWRGRRVSLELTLSGPGAVLVDGSFEPAR